MNKTFTIAISLALFVCSCQAPDPFHTLQGEWYLSAYENLQTGAISPAPSHLPQPVTGVFEDRGKRGNYRIETATNALWGKYKLTTPSTIEMGEVQGTLMGENQWTEQVWEALQGTFEYQFSSGRDTLILYFDEGDKCMRWQKNP